MRAIASAAVLSALLAATPALALADAAAPDLDATAHGDAAATHGFAFDTGLVLGGGEVGVSARTIANRGTDVAAAVGLGGGLELSIDGLDAHGYSGVESLRWVGAQLRMRVARGRRYTVSIAASYHTSWTTEDDSWTYPASTARSDVYGAGADAAFAITRRLALSAGAGVTRFSGDSAIFYGHADATLAVISHLKLLVEVGELRGALAVLGARFATHYVSADLGVGFAGQTSEAGEALEGPVLVFAVSARL